MWVAVDTTGTPPIDSEVFVGVFGMYWECIGAPATAPAAENKKITTISVATQGIRCKSLHDLC